MTAALRRWNIAAGNFFFRRRNALFPVLFIAAVLLGRPRIMINPQVDRLLIWIGLAVALLGESVRLFTIGFEYIERGGKEGKIHASRLVQGGIYSLTRNPMYLGNMLIAIGITMVVGAPLVYLIVLPFFLFVYQALITAEEAYLRPRFGADYEKYCRRVPVLFPALHQAPKALQGLHYNWRKAIRKDLSTLAGLFCGLSVLPVVRSYFLHGFAQTKDDLLPALLLLAGILALYGLLVYLKKHRRLLYTPADFPEAFQKRA